MALVRARNPWGQLLDAQRSDLWQVDLYQVVDGIKKSAGSFPRLDEGRLIDAEAKDHSFYVSKVQLPTVSMENSLAMNGSMPVNLPGADSALSEVKIDFLVDASKLATSYGQPQTLTDSKIYYTLMAWRGLARAGRYTESSGDNFVALLQPTNLKPNFRFTVAVRMLAGQPTYQSEISSNRSSNDFTNASLPNQNQIATNEIQLESTTEFYLMNCWCREISLSNLEYSSKGDPMTVSASLVCSAIKTIRKYAANEA